MPEESNHPVEPAQTEESKRPRNINTGGGMHNESGTTPNSGGVNVSGGQVEGGVHYIDEAWS